MSEEISSTTINRILYLCMSYATCSQQRDKESYAMKATELARVLIREGKKRQIQELHEILEKAKCDDTPSNWHRGWDAALRCIAIQIDDILEKM
jgi:hypothetical protein